MPDSMNYEALLALVDVIYEAVFDPAEWANALTRLQTGLGAGSGVLHAQTLSTPQGSRVLAAVGVDPAMQRLYEEHYCRVNVWTVRGQHLLRPGAVLTGQMICTDAEFERSEYYADYLRRLDLFHSIAAIPTATGGSSLILSLLAPRRRGPFGEDEIRLFRALEPHLSRASAVHARLVAARREGEVLTSALEHIAHGVVVLDHGGRVLFANRAARLMAQSNDGFSLVADGVDASVAAETRSLRQAVAAAARSGSPADRGATLRLTRPSGKRPLHALVVPLTGDTAQRLQEVRAGVALFLTDLDASPRTANDTLRVLFGLTPSEARVAGALAQGIRLQDVASQFGLTINTARWLVKQVLQKTGTSTQAQLVALLGRVCPPVLPDGW